MKFIRFRVSSTRRFLQNFSAELLKNLSFRAFCREQMVHWVEYISFKPIFFWVIIAECHFVVSKRNIFLRFMNVGHFWDFHAHIASAESVSALNVWLRLKNSKWMILWSSYHTYCIAFSSMKLDFEIDFGDLSSSVQSLLLRTVS